VYLPNVCGWAGLAGVLLRAKESQISTVLWVALQRLQQDFFTFLLLKSNDVISWLFSLHWNDELAWDCSFISQLFISMEWRIIIYVYLSAAAVSSQMLKSYQTVSVVNWCLCNYDIPECWRRWRFVNKAIQLDLPLLSLCRGNKQLLGARFGPVCGPCEHGKQAQWWWWWWWNCLL